MNYYIGADLGTSALKLLLVNENKEILNSVSKSYEVIYPSLGWSEQNPEKWWNAFCSGINELLINYDSKLVKGISVAGQMHGLVILDKDDNIIRNAILWNDGRCQKETDYLNNVIGKANLSKYTGNIAFAGFTAPKVLWVKENEPENFNSIVKLMLPKDYINYKLTGVHSIDYSDASGTLLLDVCNKCWSKEMLEICGLNLDQMPKLFESYDKVGYVKEDIARVFNLNDKVVVAAGAGDNAGAAIGMGTVNNGMCNISLGTSGTAFISADRYVVDDNNSLHSFCHANGNYHLMACMLSAAFCNKWFCEDILNITDFSNLQNNISNDLLGNNSIYFLPYLMGERSPINDTDASALFIGLRGNTNKYEMYLAVLEGVCFALRDSIEIVRSHGINIDVTTVCGGGAKSDLWINILSNVLNVKVLVPENEQGPGFGASLLAMKACNLIIDYELPSIKKEVIPNADLVNRYNERYKKFKLIYPTIKELYKEIKE